MSDILPPYPRANFDPQLVTFYAYKGYPFDNFSSFMVDWPTEESPFNLWWPKTRWLTSETGFHAARFMLTAPDLVDKIAVATSAHEAWEIKEHNRDRQHPLWRTDLAAHVMLDICRHKAKQHAHVRKTLRESGNAEIVEHSMKDGYWGIGKNYMGQNMLGKIWMRLREEQREGKIPA